MKNNENGQALIEFLMFLPLLLIMYTTTVSIGNSINGSINQQKVTRGYLYNRILNNSTIPKPSSSDQSFKRWRRFGMFFIGYSKEKRGQEPYAACYKLKLPFSNGETSCERYNKTSTSFVRVETVYGLCGNTYFNNGGVVSWAAINANSIRYTPQRENCEILQ